ncbi:MAG TPA: metal ABC transporter substrate-binding protein [Anaerolineales bacterium]|nr:metal ABC transporter substrate-binding protein [Anaerolineales bacterium]
MFTKRALFLLLTLVATACRPSASSDSGADPVVLTSTTFLADITRNIAGERLPVDSLLPIGTDPHSYQPVPRDVARIRNSKVFIVNGAGYEVFLESLLENAGGESTLIEASAGLSPGADAENAPGIDPHFWLDPNHVIVYVENIREGLARFDSEGAAVYQANAEAYAAGLKDLDAWIIEKVDQIPPDKRLLVTNHEALGYFAERYGFTIVGTVIGSFSSEASPSAQQMAALVDQIRTSRASAIFLDTSDNPALARQIAEETGVQIVTGLHLESLTDGPPAGTYIDMMKHNVTQIVNALK